MGYAARPHPPIPPFTCQSWWKPKWNHELQFTTLTHTDMMQTHTSVMLGVDVLGLSWIISCCTTCTKPKHKLFTFPSSQFYFQIFAWAVTPSGIHLHKSMTPIVSGVTLHHKLYMPAMTQQQPAKIFHSPTPNLLKQYKPSPKHSCVKREGPFSINEVEITWIFNFYLMAANNLNSSDPTLQLCYAGYCWSHDKEAYISNGFWKSRPLLLFLFAPL